MLAVGKLCHAEYLVCPSLLLVSLSLQIPHSLEAQGQAEVGCGASSGQGTV